MIMIPRSIVDVESIRTFYNPYLNDLETTILVALVRSVLPKVMIEVGCQQGRTAKTILDHVPSLEAYVGIDIPFGKRPTLKCQESEVPYSAGLWVRTDERFFLLVRDRGSLDLSPGDLEPCDAFFVDGDHSEDVVLHDSYLARALVRPGGIVIWHDYGNEAVGVTQVLDKLYAEGWPITNVQGTWLAYRRT